VNNAAPRPAPGGVRRLAVVTHVVHHVHEGRVWAYAPYARELDLWAALFPTLVLVAPVRHGVPPGDCAPLDARNLVLRPMPESGGVSWRAKGRQLVRAPWLAWRLWRQLAGVDAVHVRCPGNIGLLGVLVAPLRSRRLVAKYAGQWAGYPGEPRTVRLQRQLLRSGGCRGPSGRTW
jgi:hypothetical protein